MKHYDLLNNSRGGKGAIHVASALEKTFREINGAFCAETYASTAFAYACRTIDGEKGLLHGDAKKYLCAIVRLADRMARDGIIA